MVNNFIKQDDSIVINEQPVVRKTAVVKWKEQLSRKPTMQFSLIFELSLIKGSALFTFVVTVTKPLSCCHDSFGEKLQNCL